MAGPFTLDELARRTGGWVEGDGGVLIERVATLKSADARSISFVSNPKYRADALASSARALIVTDTDAALAGRPLLLHANPYACFARVAGMFDRGIHQASGIDPTAVISVTASLGSGVSIGAHVSIGAGVVIGDNAVVYPNVTIYPGTIIGHNAIIQAGAVIGSDGFGFAADAGTWVKIPQTGRVVVGDDVEVGAGTTIDRGALDDTVIGDGVKLDNQIQIGHNVTIGAHTAMAGCVGVAGSASIGRHCTFGGGAIILGHLTISDHVHVTAGSLVTKSIDAAGTYGASLPATNNRDWLKNAAHLRNLVRMDERIRALEREIGKMEKKS